MSTARLLCVVGPTASGKTELALKLAERYDGEIISADSVQIYRRFDIGSGKPSTEERSRAPHHLIDELDPLEPIDAARFADLARDRIAAIVSRQRRPIVCGGTFLWVRALIYGLSPAPQADASIRQRHRQLADLHGRAHLHRELERVDAETAARLSANDLVRISRALEVFEQTGIPLSRWHAGHGFRTPLTEARLIGIARSREELDRRIDVRTRAMFERGFVAEVRSLAAAGYASARAMRSVGYRQIAEALSMGSIDQASLIDKVYRATRVFARRQRTWLRDQPVEWLTPEQAEQARLEL